MRTQVNGDTLDFSELRPDESALDLVRERVGLTGAKKVCESGVCGGCTMLVDGVPMATCVLPAALLEGRSVQTVEGVSQGGLHPVQRAFMASDALQCGFCTPGFVMASVAFCDEWRARKPGEIPSRAEIAAGLAGNLCRCAAYEGIYDAVERVCAGEFDRDEPVEAPRMEAESKVTGVAKYTVDQKYEDQLEGVLLRSPHPHAKIRSIDASEALAMPGVSAFIELDVPDSVARYTGQAIGALAASDRSTARQALSRVRVDYEVLPASVSMKRAAEAGAPTVYDGDASAAPNASEGLVPAGPLDGNIHTVVNPFDPGRGEEAEQALARSRGGDGEILHLEFENRVQVHTPLEPHACVAKWEDASHLTVHISTQAVHRVAGDLAAAYGLEPENVVTHAEHVGGGFGAKHPATAECHAAVRLAKESGKPVRVAQSRLEELCYTSHRPGGAYSLSLATDASGNLDGIGLTAYQDTGVSIGGGIAAFLGMGAPPVALSAKAYDVVTNTPPAAPFRGPAGPQAAWVLEPSLSQLAIRQGLDPADARKRWYGDDPQFHHLLDWVQGLPVWGERGEAKGSGRYREGVGLAMGTWPYLYNPQSRVTVGVDEKGIYISCATQDVGTGTRSVLAGAVAEVLEMEARDVDVRMGTSDAPLGPSAGGSVITNSVYGPSVTAAESVRDKLNDACQKLGLSDPECTVGGVRHDAGLLPWKELLEGAGQISTTETRGVDGAPLPVGAPDPASVPTFMFGSHRGRSATVVKLRVDTRLGIVRPVGAWIAISTGKIFFPKLAESQVTGAVIQGFGYAFTEERVIDEESGFHLTSTLEDYHIPGLGDTPPIHVHFMEEAFDDVRMKGFGLAELATISVAAAVGNAMYDATGWLPQKTPIRPEDVIEGVQS